MSEYRLLDLLAQDAPVAGRELADAVIHRAHQARRRRRAAAAASGAVALVAAIPIAISMARAPQHTTKRPPEVVANQPNGKSQDSDTSQVYAAGIRYLSVRLAPGMHWQVLYVHDQACTIGFELGAPCRPRAIPAAVKAELASILAPYAPVRFVGQDAQIRDKDLQVINHGIAITLGRIELAGDTARLPLWVQCGGLCGLGQTLKLAKVTGAWKVVGNTGTTVVS
jgi:hypothetical protein